MRLHTPGDPELQRQLEPLNGAMAALDEQLIGWLDHAIDGGMVFELEPECPCPREHPWLYSDSACDAALRRQQLVDDAARDTSRAIAERLRREALQGRRQMP